MLAGSTGYDVVDMAASSMTRFIKAGVFQKLDRGKLPSWGNQDPVILQVARELGPGQRVRNAVHVGHDRHHLQCRHGEGAHSRRRLHLDGPDLQAGERRQASRLRHLDPRLPSRTSSAWACAISASTLTRPTSPTTRRWPSLYKPIRKYIRTFDSSNYLNALPNKELCVVNNWSGDYATAKTRAEEAGVKDLNLAYYVPKTGAPLWCDCMAIPADAKRVENAHKFLEFLLQPEVIAGCTNFINYANGNLPAKKFVNPDILNNPAIYPDEATMKLLFTPTTVNDEQDKAMTKAFTQIKSG